MSRTLIRDYLEGPFQARMEPFHGSVLTVEFPSLEHCCVPCGGVVVVAEWLVAGRGFPPWHPGEEGTPQGCNL